MTDRFRFVDLFAGVGGFHHALASPAFGGESVLAVEFDAACQRVYSAAFPQTPLVGDIRSITRRPDGSDSSADDIRAVVPEHDVLCAGFPCQPFSKSGSQRGVLDETRGTLFFDIMQIVKAREPRFLVLENVPNLVGPRHRETWRTIVDRLRQAGYQVSAQPVILSPHRIPPPYGAPQVRDRVFILAARGAVDPAIDIPPLLPKRPYPYWDPNSWSVADYLHAHPGPSHEIRPVERVWLEAWDAFVRGVPSDRLPGFPIWVDAWLDEPDIEPDDASWKVEFKRKNSNFFREHKAFLTGWLEEVWDDKGTTVRDFPLSRRKFEWQARVAHPRRVGRTLWDLLIQLRPSGIRVRPATYFPALVAINQTSIIGEEARRITAREAAALQGIPYEPFEQAGVDEASVYKQLGNAVNVGAVQLAASALFQEYGESWGQEVQATRMQLIA